MGTTAQTTDWVKVTMVLEPELYASVEKYAARIPLEHRTGRPGKVSTAIRDILRNALGSADAFDRAVLTAEETRMLEVLRTLAAEQPELYRAVFSLAGDALLRPEIGRLLRDLSTAIPATPAPAASKRAGRVRRRAAR